LGAETPFGNQLTAIGNPPSWSILKVLNIQHDAVVKIISLLNEYTLELTPISMFSATGTKSPLLRRMPH
jgi:hypothetical protein